MIAVESERLERLVQNLLDLSRLQAGGAEPRTDWCTLDELVRSAVDSVAAPPAGFDVDLDPDLPLVRADAAQLERALANVLENSVQFAGDEPVAVRGHATDRNVVLRISDRGPGSHARSWSECSSPSTDPATVRVDRVSGSRSRAVS